VGWSIECNRQLDASCRLCAASRRHTSYRFPADKPNCPLMCGSLLEMTARRGAGRFDHAINLRITRLRYQIEIDPAHPRLIRTARGVRYIFVPKN
jgi:DNA-binding response OmpR family regulator